MKSLQSLLILFLGTITFISAQDKTLKERIDGLLKANIEESDAGLFIGVVQNGEIIYEGYRGLANLEHQVPVGPLTRSNIASTSKQFVALMLLEMSMKGQVSLEEDVRKFLPSIYPKVKETIKLRHLLNHTSGIRDIYDLLSIQNKPWWKQVGFDVEDAMELVEKQEELAFTPGFKYTYSNTGYLLLTQVIEKISGQDFHDYSKAFFQKMGMNNTEFLKNYMLVIPNKAVPYVKWGQNSPWKEYPMLTSLYGDGFLFTTLPDMLTFEAAIQKAKQNNNQLLLQSQEAIPNSEVQTYGYGLKLFDRLNYSARHHDGSTGAYHSESLRFPEQNLTVFVMGNNGNQWSGSFTEAVAKMILPKKEMELNYDARLSTIKNSGSAPVVGQYLSRGNYTMRIEEKDGKYTWHNANNRPLELVKESESVLAFTDGSGEKLGFTADQMLYFYPNGKVSEYNRLHIPKPTAAELESYTGKYYSSELDFTFRIEYKDGKLLYIEGKDDTEEMDIVNREEILAQDYILKVQRDAFDRVVGLRLTISRVQNNLFVKKTKLQFQPKAQLADGSIQVTTIGGAKNDPSQILLTKNKPNGNEIWNKRFGGKSYDKASSILSLKDGYLIVGSTSSFGNGNYDMFVIKTDLKGNKLWQETYGEFANEYGYSAEETDQGYIIKGTKQDFETYATNNPKSYKVNVWYVTIDKHGKELSNTLLEEID